MKRRLRKTRSTAKEMNDEADNNVDDVAHPVDDLDSLNPRLISSQEEVTASCDVLDIGKDQENTERRNSLKQEEEDDKYHPGGGDTPSSHEKAQSLASAEGHDSSNTRGEDQKQPKSKDIKDHPQEESKEDEDPERRSSVKQEEENTAGDIHSAEESPPTGFGLGKWILATFVLVLALLASWTLTFESPPVQKQFNLTYVFHQEMDKVQSSFPSQPSELWRRSRIHLRRHLQMTHPTEPVSLLLTSGRGAEKTLACLAQRLAAAFSTALNASVLDIDGASKTKQDAEQVKLDIDIALKEAFEGGKRSAIIHRFEELPPGATLIFYRYCDHENAVYKKVFLMFTVLLDNLELSPNISLGLVEEMVQEYLKNKFISSDRTATFNQMDVDKLSGLWSRISHVILPVAAENTIEQQGCRERG
ncbi:torsin-1A-interacting protein 2 isoform X2 [Electrophorus electricus]|uniref:torsin-1A-interacting protein 2 isoform X2 n=1 Tax=Electrophorus electricus TaxID=8005 RepID=UPI0015D06B9D|nr:torsin-1A-interacting protein 2 isoform X2 [Electrophorus electricus]